MTVRIDDDYLIRLLAELVNIPSVFPNEEQVMLFLEDELSRIGLTPDRIPVADRRFNLLVRLGNGDPVFCLNAHSDTVPSSGNSIPEARVEGGVMRGLGSADDKASIAAMVAAVRAIKESSVPLAGTLDLLISVDEEGDASGVRTAVEQGYRCDWALVGEPSNLEIVPSHCGLVFLDLVTHGKSTHGSIPGEGINAIERMYELVSGLRGVVTDYPPHAVLGPPTLNLGIMQGGDRPNRVPNRCEASVDIRVVPPMTVEQVISGIEDYFSARSEEAEFTITKQGGALDTQIGSPLIRALSAAAEKVAGSPPPFACWRGWTEAESFRSRLGIDAVVFGPGGLTQAHSADEFVELEQVRRAARIYAETALSILTVSGKSEIRNSKSETNVKEQILNIQTPLSKGSFD